MAWNEPGGNNQKDPWGNDQGPPDLDEAFRKWKERLTGGGRGGKPGKGGPSGSSMPESSLPMVGVVLAGLLLLWVGLGIYQIDEQERAVVLRFGKYLDIAKPGLQWNPPLIDSVQKINISKVRSLAHRGLMLTEDDNIVDVSLSVQYTVNDPKKFLLEVRDPEVSLSHATESAIRHVIGSAGLHEVLTDRAQITIETRQRIQRYVDNYHTGILVSTVNIEDAQPPPEVQAAFDDVIRAKEDEARAKNEAETYKNGIVPEARGMAKRQMEEANAYRDQVIARARGEADRFNQLLEEYEKAPMVTRQRLYIDSMQRVMGKTSKVLVDAKGSNVIYLPLDRLTGQAASESSINSSSGITPLVIPESNLRDSGRTSPRREGR